jgi:VanZ family protein
MKLVQNITRYWLPALLWMALIALMSTAVFSDEQTSRTISRLLGFFFPVITPKQLAAANFIVRKAAHVTVYFSLCLLLYRAFRAGSTERLQLRWVICAAIVSIACAASDEFHQSFVYNRTPSVVDVMIDTAGVIIAVFPAINSRYRVPAGIKLSP